jgi:hypothetical protein
MRINIWRLTLRGGTQHRPPEVDIGSAPADPDFGIFCTI